MNCRAKFGVSFHANMALEDIIYLWCKRVTPEIKALYPEIDDLIRVIDNALFAIQTARRAYVTALQLLKTIQQGVEAAAAVTAGQGVAYVAALAGVEQSNLALGLAQDALRGVGVQVSANIGCSFEDDLKVPLLYLSELDALYLKLSAAMGVDFCGGLRSLTR
jgi:hypothetical protein